MKLLTILSFICLPIFASGQTKEQAMLALRSEEHTKVEIVDSTVIFTDHSDSLKNVNSYEYLALELAESLYKQMSDKVYNPYFNAIFADGLIYKNIINSADQTTITITATHKSIHVKITKLPSITLADEHFDF